MEIDKFKDLSPKALNEQAKKIAKLPKEQRDKFKGQLKGMVKAMKSNPKLWGASLEDGRKKLEAAGDLIVKILREQAKNIEAPMSFSEAAKKRHSAYSTAKKARTPEENKLSYMFKGLLEDEDEFEKILEEIKTGKQAVGKERVVLPNDIIESKAKSEFLDSVIKVTGGIDLDLVLNPENEKFIRAKQSFTLEESLEKDWTAETIFLDLDNIPTEDLYLKFIYKLIDCFRENKIKKGFILDSREEIKNPHILLMLIASGMLSTKHGIYKKRKGYTKSESKMVYCLGIDFKVFQQNFKKYQRTTSKNGFMESVNLENPYFKQTVKYNPIVDNEIEKLFVDMFASGLKGVLSMGKVFTILPENEKEANTILQKALDKKGSGSYLFHSVMNPNSTFMVNLKVILTPKNTNTKWFNLLINKHSRRLFTAYKDKFIFPIIEEKLCLNYKGSFFKSLDFFTEFHLIYKVFLNTDKIYAHYLDSKDAQDLNIPYTGQFIRNF